MQIYYSGYGYAKGEEGAEHHSTSITSVMPSYYETIRTKGQRERVEKMAKSDLPVVRSHFLDSGAFTLWTKAAKYAKEHGCGRWDYYDTDEFWQYMDDYAKFVKKYQVGIDLYANVDVIPNPKLTWRNQRYLEKEHGLKPVPVVHYPEKLKWLQRYIDKGYELIGVGGLVGRAGKGACRHWLGELFDMVCDTPNRCPKVKLHGFGITSYPLLIEYPWFSVDSVTWARAGGFGSILVPHKRYGKFDFSETPYTIAISIESDKRKKADNHYLTISKRARAIVDEWLEEIGMPLGRIDGKGEVTEFGVLTRHTERRAANILFFERLSQWLPEWPWPYKGSRMTGLGLI